MKHHLFIWRGVRLLAIGTILGGSLPLEAFQHPEHRQLPNFEKRSEAGADRTLHAGERGAAVAKLRARLPKLQIEADPVTGSPKSIANGEGFLTGPRGRGLGVGQQAIGVDEAGDPLHPIKAFVNEHKEIFEHDAAVLDEAKLRLNTVTEHSGIRSAMWEQELDGIPVLGGDFMAHVSRNGELINISSRFVPNLRKAADSWSGNRAALQAKPPVPPERAIGLAAESIGEQINDAKIAALNSRPEGRQKLQHFKADSLPGETVVRLVWFPVNRTSMQLCWEVYIARHTAGELYRVLVDARTGELVARHPRTFYLSDASYRVFVSDSPSPFSPGHAVPLTTQPPLVSRTLVTTPALNTTASPIGWIYDGWNETVGNNVVAQLDRDGDNGPDLPRPQGSPFRVFDFPLDLTQPPGNSAAAGLANLFYWANFAHDKLYEVGFTEGYANFQKDNFGRGGRDSDPVYADAQDGSGFNNANWAGGPDGSPARIQMFIFTGPDPDRDGDLDAEVVLHEYVHGLSDRLVGRSLGLQTQIEWGMGEGWSDFYSLALLGESGDNLHGNYPAGGYLTYQFVGLTENYYFGIRRYPYSTDMAKNPLTFKDIDPNQASSHPGIPISARPARHGASEVHNMGEVWCVTLWEMRAQLIEKHGFAVGNQLALRLVTDGMKLVQSQPNMIQARAAILQADQIYNGSANHPELWRAFAKRGMGVNATSPAGGIVGVVENFDVPAGTAMVRLELPAQASENAGTLAGAGTVRLTATRPTPLVVTLIPANSGLLTTPSSVTIPAGQLTAPFDITLVDDAVADGTQIGIITARGPGLGSATDTIDIVDNETPLSPVASFAFSSVASPQAATVPFSVTVTAKDANNATVTGFSGPAQLSAWSSAGNSGTIVVTEVFPGAIGQVEFQNVSGGNINVGDWQILVYDRTTWPNPQQIYPIAPGTICTAGQRFVLRFFENQTGPLRFPGNFPFLIGYSKISWTDDPAGNPIAVLVRDNFGNIVDFMCADSADPALINNPVPIVPTHWNGPSVPARLNTGHSYQRQGSVDLNARTDWKIANHNMNTNNPGLTLPFPGRTPVAMTPASSGSFVNGVWTGNVTVQERASGVYLQAQDDAQHAGFSGTFNVQAANDVGVTISASKTRIMPGNDLVYTITVTNSGPSTATALSLTDQVPSGVAIVQATPSQGSCMIGTDQVSCSLGSLAGSGNATVTVTVRPSAIGSVTSVATLTRGEADALSINNTASVVTEVGHPLIFSRLVNLTEGNSGTLNAVVPVWLSASSSLEVSVQYATVDISAKAGSDYITTAGTLTFVPGQVNANINIPIIGDTLDESNDVFMVVFSSPVNGIFAAPPSLVTITNNDSPSQMNIADAAIVEGHSGGVNAVFEVRLSAPSERASGAFYTAVSDTAYAGADFMPVSGHIYFAPGTTLQTITVPIVSDRTFERTESFTVELAAGSPWNAWFGDRFGTGTITDDDSDTHHVFGLSTIASPQHINCPFPVTITARDFAGNPFTGFSGSVSVRGSTADRTAIVGTQTTNWMYPLATSFQDQRLQTIYLAADIAGAGRITSLALDVNGVPGPTLDNWTIRVKHTPLSAYTSNPLTPPAWEGAGWTTVYQRNQTVYSNGWAIFHLSTPFDYNGTDNLMVDFSFNSARFSPGDGQCRSSVTADGSWRSIYFRTDSAFGDPLNWTGNTPQAIGINRFPNLKFSFENPIGVTPTTAGPFVNGVWSGSIAVLNQASAVRLHVNDGNEHVGMGNVFDVVPINAAPSFVKGPDVNVPMNSGTYSASGWATSISPGPNESGQTVDFIVSNNNNSLFSVQPAISPGGTLTFTPASGFSGGALVSVRLHDNGGTACFGTDTSPEQTLYINVVPPFTVTIAAPDSFAQEPDFGVNSGQFLLTRTGTDYSQTLTVSYSVSGSAASGQDYQALSGTAIFGANQTTVPIALTPINDFTWEGDETVVVTLVTANGYAVGSPGSATVVIVAILDLGALPSATDSYGFSLNNSGRVTGVSGNRAFATSPNSAISYTSDLHGALATHFGGGSGTTSAAWDITDTGAMAGEFGNSSTTNAWYRTPSGSIQTISAPNSSANYLRAIREWETGSTGAGFSTVGGYNRFCNWYIYDNNPGSTYVYNIGGSLWPSHHSYAFGVVSNKIVGYIANYNSSYNQAVLWDWNGSFAYYLNSPGDSQTEAYDIAPYYPNYYTIAGHAANGSVRSACYWVYSAGSASVTKLGNPYNWHSTGRGINAGYRVVGSVHPHYNPSPTYQHACIWDSGTFIDLYNLGTASGWSLFSAEKLSTQSQITGYGYINGQMHAFLMTQ